MVRPPSLHKFWAVLKNQPKVTIFSINFQTTIHFSKVRTFWSCKGRTRGRTPSRGDVDDALGDFQLTLVDALDTLALLGFTDEFQQAIQKINSTLKLDGDFMISTFETNIRMLGGLLGGHSVALDLADKGS